MSETSCYINNMKILIDSNDLTIIADDILSNIRMLELSDADSAEEDLDLYLSKIRRAAEDLNGIAANSEPAEGGAR